MSCFGFGNDLVDSRGEDTRLFRFVEDTEFRGEAGIDGVVGDESAGHRVDGADECGADLFGSGNVAVIEQALLGLFDEVGGGTDMYAAAAEGLRLLQGYDLTQYTPALILLTDGQSGGSFSEFAQAYAELGQEVPVFSIMFGDADEEQLQELAQYTNARVFDGREDLTAAFRSVKGYN